MYVLVILAEKVFSCLLLKKRNFFTGGFVVSLYISLLSLFINNKYYHNEINLWLKMQINVVNWYCKKMYCFCQLEKENTIRRI